MHFSCLTIINACNIPQFLECKTQILFITVWDTPGTRIRKQLFYFISVITFQQISFTFQFGWKDSTFPISSPWTVSQQKAPLVRFPLQQLIAQGSVCRLGLPQTRAVTARMGVCEQVPSVSPPPPTPWLSRELSGVLRQGRRTQCQVSNTNYQLQLPSDTFINMCLMEGGLFPGHVSVACGRCKATAFRVSCGRRARRGPELCEAREQLCTNKPWEA